ncbi:hypothetical protein DO021_14455 [Desulfobacter hydrogenophilus]|uniref:HTH cro/C1-type domain-containing protein n=1 Tax=Desulfobacter hydrogenophilus TaxID=2291 RepID=A0A328FE09_9BACT|nr:hypothetical protein [Desulfobacter hydrogenophilus]NDY72605.1 hypothetical protein [Desulfobacter hydrogenophilus]QBH13325.1 hypothetical protein EYB58_10565 [Desulfobacter hydrogenophilus]RAM01275.1 hypothetical protein DO021_14455 [Desulfobacter hydrogenophilus]
MRIKDVPQDPGILDDYGREICYAVDQNGNYSLAQSIGWDPKNVANRQAWQAIEKKIDKAREDILDGKLSPIGFYMVCNQMDVRLLAQYMGLYRWQVKRHLKPAVFKKIKVNVLEKYAALFNVSVDELKSLPDKPAMDCPSSP